jgi:hypothetical protein
MDGESVWIVHTFPSGNNPHSSKEIEVQELLANHMHAAPAYNFIEARPYAGKRFLQYAECIVFIHEKRCI